MQHVSLTRALAPMALTTLTALWWAGCADTTGPRWVDSVRPVPDSVHLEVGETATFDVKVFDQNDQELPAEWLPRVEWSLSNPAVATLQVLDVGVSVTALQPGTASVRAELGRGRRSARVYVQPPGLDRIEIEPSPVRVSVVTASVRASALLLDSSGAEMSPQGFRISWEFGDTTVVRPTHSTDPFAIVSGLKAGQTTLSLKVGNTTAHADVFVIAGPMPPSAPRVNTLSSSSLGLSWNRLFAASTGYRVYRSTSEVGTYTHIASTGSATWAAASDTTYVDTGLSPSTTYFYQLEACHLREGCSERSATGSGTTAGGGANEAVREDAALQVDPTGRP